MHSGRSSHRHRADISNILSKFSEKYLHQLDRSQLDTLLKNGRLVGDLTDLELEYLGFSLVNQLIWLSFSAHNNYLRYSSSEDQVNQTSNNRRKEFNPTVMQTSNPSLSLPSLPKQNPKPFVSNVLSLPMPSIPQLEDREHPQVSLKKGSGVLHQSEPSSKRPIKKPSQNRGSSILDLPNPSVLAPETPEVISKSALDPLLSIPETEFPDFAEGDDIQRTPRSQSPILIGATGSRPEVGVLYKEDTQDDYSPSIISKKRQVDAKENKWGILPDSKGMTLPKKEVLKQGSIQEYMRPSQFETERTKALNSDVSFTFLEEAPQIDGPVRTKSGRALLEGFECQECKAYYKDTNLSEEQVKKLLKTCSRHRAKEPPPLLDLQNERWELEIRDDEENEMNRTQMGPPLKLRKKRKESLR